MNVLFIGGFFPPDRQKEIVAKSKGIIQFAANNFQWSFINGLSSHLDNFSVYTAPSIGSFPNNFKSLFFRGSIYTLNRETDCYCAGFLNIPIIGLFTKCISLFILLIKHKKGNNSYLLVYSVHTPFLLAAIFYKILNNKSKICLIVPDLPEYMSANTSWAYKLLKYLDLKIISLMEKYVDSFVFITDQMTNRFNTTSKPWVRIEGMFEPSEVSKDNCSENKEEKIVLYSGTLDSRYGIRDLLDAFTLINNLNYRLWICGDGNMRNHVIEYSKFDARIKYYGQLTKIEVAELQNRATVLVNPRTSNGEYTKYSFPIKTMEYLASGKPTIMNMLPGIPEEYRQYLFVPESETPIDLMNKIIEVCSLDSGYYAKLCNSSKQFVLEKKNSQIQTKKIIDEIINLNLK